MPIENDKPKESRLKWDDPSVPVGNAPPMPRWPVVLAAIAWLAWLVFLITMLASHAGAATT